MRKSLSAVWSLALLFGGCPQRQTAPRIVYIPVPPATAQPPVTTATLVIQQPAPPATLPLPTPAPAASVRRPRSVRTKRAAPPAAVEQAPVPQLGPRESPAQENALRNSVIRLQRAVERDINRLDRSGLPESELSALGGARVFLAESIRALQDNDPQTALNLVRKAQLLVQALEKPL
jgi:hypothetical protein